MMVATGRQYIGNTSFELQDANIERATAKVIDQQVFVALLFTPIRQGCSRRLVDELQHVETSHLTSSLSAVTLHLAEIGRNGNHHVVDGILAFFVLTLLVSEIYQVAQDERGYLNGVVALAVDGHLIVGV